MRSAFASFNEARFARSDRDCTSFSKDVHSREMSHKRDETLKLLPWCSCSPNRLIHRRQDGHVRVFLRVETTRSRLEFHLPERNPLASDDVFCDFYFSIGTDVCSCQKVFSTRRWNYKPKLLLYRSESLFWFFVGLFATRTRRAFKSVEKARSFPLTTITSNASGFLAVDRFELHRNGEEEFCHLAI